MPDGAPITPGGGLGVASDEIASNLTGTVSKNGTVTVAGVGTAFSTELSVGQVLRIPGGGGTEDRTVSVITSDTSLTVTAAYTNTAATQVGQVVKHYQLIKLAKGALDTALLISDTEGLPIQSVVSSTAALANVAGSASSVTLQASNANRIGLTIYNDSTATLFVKFGATASSTSYTVQMGPGAYYEMPIPIYSGIIDGIWTSGTGSARMTELT